jgi:hypothetical protein
MYALLAVNYNVDILVYFQDTLLCIYQEHEDKTFFKHAPCIQQTPDFSSVRTMCIPLSSFVS